ncbi:MAG: hypothetical protein PETM_03037 [Petrimonas sp.]
MISRKKELELIKTYMYVCDLYDQELKYYCQRYSNNSNPVFTDQEIMTIYLFAGHCQKYFQIKDIHNFASEYLSSWVCLFHPKSIPVFQSKSIPFKINLQTCFVSIAILAVPPK